MYCVKCGVELADSELKCPLCGTVVYHPDIVREEKSPPFPRYTPPHDEFNRSGFLFILTFLFAIPFLLALIIDLSLAGRITWSGYVTCSLVVAYVATVLPFWFKKPIVEGLIATDFVFAALLLLYINLTTGGKWFLTFALPVTAVAGILTVTVVALLMYHRHMALYIIGGAFATLGGFAVVVEALVNMTFGVRDSLVWSIYPLTVFVLIGIMLIVIALSPTLRESLERKFFI